MKKFFAIVMTALLRTRAGAASATGAAASAATAAGSATTAAAATGSAAFSSAQAGAPSVTAPTRASNANKRFMI